jgi:Homeodomain
MEPWRTTLRTALAELPSTLRSALVGQAATYVQQADFLRKALHVQAALTGADGLAPQAPVQDGAPEQLDEEIDAIAIEQLELVFGVADTPGPALEEQLAAVLQLSAKQVGHWFAERRAAAQAQYKRLRKRNNKRVTAGAAHAVVPRFSTNAQTAAQDLGAAPLTACAPHLPLVDSRVHMNRMLFNVVPWAVAGRGGLPIASQAARARRHGCHAWRH